MAEGTDVINELKDYLRRVCPPLLDLDTDAIRFEESMEQPSTSKIIGTFVNDKDTSTIFIGFDGNVTVEFGFEPIASPRGVAVLKRKNSQILSEESIHQQVQILTLGLDLDVEHPFLRVFQQYTRNIFGTLSRPLGQSLRKSDGSETGDSESVISLQRKIRELDLALEQCQTGTVIPSVTLSLPQIFLEAASKTNAAVLKTYLEKYNVSQVSTQADQLLGDLGLGSIIAERREDFASEVNRYAKLWPEEIAKQTKLSKLAFQGSADQEINFWKEMERKLTGE